jgi:hypothetical protein
MVCFFEKNTKKFFVYGSRWDVTIVSVGFNEKHLITRPIVEVLSAEENKKVVIPAVGLVEGNSNKLVLSQSDYWTPNIPQEIFEEDEDDIPMKAVSREEMLTNSKKN